VSASSLGQASEGFQRSLDVGEVTANGEAPLECLLCSLS